MRKFILDVDTGIDDSLAISYLLTFKDIEIAGITTTFGNVVVEKAFENTTNLLAALGRSDIPVYSGANCALGKTEYTPDDVKIRVHGKNGIGNVELPDSGIKDSGIKAWDFMIDCCNKYGKDLTIIQVGAMTNLVKAWQKDPKAVEKIGKVVVMGGALTVPGNCNPFAEANFLVDPLAAKILLESGLPVTMVGLDVTLQTVITENEIKSWSTVNSIAANALYQMCQYYYSNEGDSHQKLSGCLHDPLAIEVAVNPDIVTLDYNCDLTVETEGVSAGRSIGKHSLILKGPRTTKVCLRVKAEEFVSKFSQSIYQLLKNS